MPRVHGIDIVPRRGRGRVRPRPGFSGGGSSGGAISSHVSSSNNNVESINFESQEEVERPLSSSTSQLNGGNDNDNNPLEDINGDTLRLSLEGNDNGEEDLKAKADEIILPAEDLGGIETATKEEQTKSAAKAPDHNPPSSAAIPPMSTATTNNTIHIKPQAKETLNDIQFSTTSFSVQEIVHKSPSKTAAAFNNNNNCATDNDILVSSYSNIGIGPSLEQRHIDDKVHSTKSIAEKKNVSFSKEVAGSSSTPVPAVGGDTKEADGGKEITAESANTMTIPTTEAKATMSNNNNSNAHWLYKRCSTACIKMQTLLSPLDLAIKTLQAIQSISITDAKDEDNNNNNFSEHLQHELFNVLKNGKRRDLDFVFEVADRALELREDELLNESSLQDVAASSEAEAKYNEDEGNELNEALPTTVQPVESAAVTKDLHQLLEDKEQQQTTSHSGSNDGSPRKAHRSRRKKRPTKTTQNTSCADTAAAAGQEPHHAASDSNSKLPAAAVNDTTKNNEVGQADFPISKDGSLDMQDDDKWSFLPAAQLQSIKENVGGDDSPRRVTRSMGLPDEDTKDPENAEECNKSENEEVMDANAAEEPVIRNATDEEEVGENQATNLKVDNETDISKKDAHQFFQGEHVWVEFGKERHPAVIISIRNEDKMAEVRWSTMNTVEDVEVSRLLPMFDDDKEDEGASNKRRGRKKQRRSQSSSGANSEEKTDVIGNTPRCSEDTPVDNKDEVYKVKTRKRSEGKETVRIVFTGFTATRKHMQVSRLKRVVSV